MSLLCHWNPVFLQEWALHKNFKSSVLLALFSKYTDNISVFIQQCFYVWEWSNSTVGKALPHSSWPGFKLQCCLVPRDHQEKFLNAGPKVLLSISNCFPSPNMLDVKQMIDDISNLPISLH